MKRIDTRLPVAGLAAVLAVTGCTTDGTITIENQTSTEFVGTFGNRGVALSSFEYITFNQKIGTRFLLFGPDEKEVILSGEGCTRTPISVLITLKNSSEVRYAIKPDAVCLSVANNGVFIVDAVYLRQSGTSDWGENRLSGLLPQQSSTSWRIAPGLYDFLVTDTSGDSTIVVPEWIEVPIFDGPDTTWRSQMDTLFAGRVEFVVHPEDDDPDVTEIGYVEGTTDVVGQIDFGDVRVIVKDAVTEDRVHSVAVGYFFGYGYDVFIATPGGGHLPRVVIRDLSALRGIKTLPDQTVEIALTPVLGGASDYVVEPVDGADLAAWNRFLRETCATIRCFPSGSDSLLFYQGTFEASTVFVDGPSCDRKAALMLPGDEAGSIESYLAYFTEASAASMWNDTLEEIVTGSESGPNLDLFAFDDVTCASLEIAVASTPPTLEDPSIDVQTHSVTFSVSGSDEMDYPWFFDITDPTVSCADSVSGLDLLYLVSVQEELGVIEPDTLGRNHGGEIDSTFTFTPGSYSAMFQVIDDTGVNVDATEWIPFEVPGR